MFDVFVNNLILQEKHKGFDKKHFGQYFNSGLMIFNLAEMRKDNLIEKFKSEIKKEYAYPDQDILNIVCFNRIKYLDFSFQIFAGEYEQVRTNLFITIDKLEEYKNSIKTPFSFHFVGGVKPWFKKKPSYPFKRWWYYYKKSTYQEKT